MVCGDQRLTYGELEEWSSRLAHWLVGRGVRPESRVVLVLPRSVELVVAIVAVVKAGGVYVPVDPGAPRERVEFVVGDVDAVVVLDGELPDVSGLPGSDPGVRVPADAGAYVIYTSGSSGVPKGVVVSHRNVVRLLEETQCWFDVDSSDVWTLFHSAAFDFSVWELWGALGRGGRLVVVPFEVSRTPERFGELLAAEGVTVLSQTPSAFFQLVDAGVAVAESVRLVVFGGEALDVARLSPLPGGPELVNMYGITETTVHVTYQPVEEGMEGSPIGVPIPDLRVYVLDERLRPVPPGVAG
ncbi:AMP-binding protein, partial [Nonomuraea jabiensis]|uniref:AMP-binding protein n=1 Tax=Nonomuraea jabiensis TaxID=882448 RepID=UPI003D7496E2